MNCLFMGPHGPATVLKRLLTDTSVYMQVPSNAVSKAQEGNRFFVLPRRKDSAFVAENRLLSPDFYRHCLQKISANPDSLCGFELDEIMRSLTEAIRSMRQNLTIPISNSDKPYKSVEALAQSIHLLKWMKKAYPHISRFVNYLQSHLFDEAVIVTIEGCVQEAEEVWRTANLFYDNQLEELIKQIQPDIVFCQTIIPNALSFAVSTALKIKSLFPKARIILINGEWNLNNTIAQFRDELLTDEFFDIFDGAVVYSDLQPLTLCEIVQGLGSGKCLHEIENSATRHHGKIVFKVPTQQTVERYFKESSLHKFYDKVSPFPFENEPEESTTEWSSPFKCAFIFPSQQACYWNKCKFCAINSQNFLLKDPTIYQRGSETADLLLKLKKEGLNAAYLGREAVHPDILHGLVEKLKDAHAVLPWGFEGRFGTYLSTGFIESLKKAGLCGSVFGLETPSNRLHKLMNKYDDDVKISLIERIIADYMHSGLLLHVNTIMNLPGTTKEEYYHHHEWLNKQFNTHPLFHFNTNCFGLYRGSVVEKTPEAYGLKIIHSHERRARQEGIGLDKMLGFGWTYLSEVYKPDFSKNAWEETFCADMKWGINLEVLHVLYHECTHVSMLDMINGTHCFKRVQSDLKSLAQADALHFYLPRHVSARRIVKEGQQYMSLLNKNMGAMILVPNDTWRAIEIGTRYDFSIGKVLDEIYFGKPKTDREKALQSIVNLAASDFLKW